MTKILLSLLLSSYIFAGNIIEMGSYKTQEFSPSLKQTFTIPFTLKTDATVKIDIYTPDNNLIYTLKSKALTQGQHRLVWEGKDNNGTVVPNEAYNIVITAKSKTDTQIIDPRMTGGVILKNLQTKIDKVGNISYSLAKPARVLVRVGMENGPMLRVISNWIPKNRGKIRQKWNMKDSDHIVDISILDFAISVSAFTLPEYAIITTNNTAIDYLSYYKQQNFTCNTLPQEKQILKRGDEGISKHFYTCRIKDRAPRITLTLPKAKKNDQNISILENGKRTLVKVTMHPEDEAILEKAKYEVSFFVDHQFSSEEELGYMPISWSFNPNALEKGEHILTVNVSSFSGQVGVKSYKFKVK